MTILGLSAALLIIMAAGLGVTLWVYRDQRMANLAEVCAVGWFLGTGVISLLLWVGALFVSGGLLRTFVTSIALSLGVFGFLAAKRHRLRASIRWPNNVTEWVLCGVIALQFGFMLYGSLFFGLGWDGLLNFEIKARYGFMNDGVLPAAYFSDTTRDFTHQAYPLWIPLTELWLYLWMGEANQFWLKVLFVMFYFSGAILLALIANRLTSRRWIGLVTITFLSLVPCITNMPGGVQVGYADIPIAMLYLGAIGYMLCAAEKNESSYWQISALFLALLPWAKREGSILWLIAVLCGIGLSWQTRRRPKTLLWFLPGLGIMVAWKLFYSAMGKTELAEYLPMTIPTLVKNLPRVGPIVRNLMTEMINTTDWSLLWPIAAVAFASLLWRCRVRRVLVLFVAAVGPILIYASLYLFSGWPDWLAHVEQSLSRLLLHVVPVVWLAIALALQPPALKGEPVTLPATSK